MLRVQNILKEISFRKFIGNKSQEIISLVQLEDINSNGKFLCWCSDKNADALKKVKRGTVICSVNVNKELLKEKNCNYIIVENPRLAFKEVMEKFFSEKEVVYEIQKSASIHPSARISKNVRIGQNVVIEENVIVGEFSIVGANTVILKNTKIGKSVKIGCNNTIGGVGFGYEKNEKGEYEVIPHIGNVVIENNVEIGNNNCIDRAVLGSTLLKKNCKIDNLVHIAHGVVIGENSLVIANSMIGGSTVIGKNVWVAPSVSVLNKKVIADNAFIGMGAVVIKNVEKGEVIVGNPGKALKKNE